MLNNNGFQEKTAKIYQLLEKLVFLEIADL